MMTLHQFGSIFNTCCEWVTHLLQNYKSVSTNNGNFCMISIVSSICISTPRYNVMLIKFVEFTCNTIHRFKCSRYSNNMTHIQGMYQQMFYSVYWWHFHHMWQHIVNIYQTLNEYQLINFVNLWCVFWVYIRKPNLFIPAIIILCN